MTTHLRRAGFTSAALVALAAAASAPATAAPATGTDAAASFLAGQFAAGGHQLSSTYAGQTYLDAGLSADGILALTSAGVAGNEAGAATTAFAKGVGDYAMPGTDVYAGAVAKSLIVAKAQGQNPRAFGGVDLVSKLQGLEKPSGRFSDVSAYGDYSNAVTQSLAVIALQKAGAPADAKATNYLLSLRCNDGGFRLADDGSACVSDPDATSFAVQALAAAGGHGADVTKGVNFLATKQNADGGVAGGTGTTTPNANSTGLAAVAFTLGGQGARAVKAQSFVASLQYGCSFPAAVRGAIAYDRTAFAAMKSAGASGKLAGNETRATSQGLYAFTRAPLVSLTKGGATTTPAISCSSEPTSSPSTSTSTTSAPKPTTTSSSNPTSTSATPAPTSTTSATSTDATAAPTSTTSPSAPSTSTVPQSTSTTPATGPIVNTDKVSDNTVPFGFAFGAVILVTAGGAVAYARRR